MSDYLANLVERSFAPAPRIRPQLPSLFEQPAVTTSLEPPAAFDRTLGAHAAPQRARVTSDTAQPPLAPPVEHSDVAERDSFPAGPRTSIHRELTREPNGPIPSVGLVPALRPNDTDRLPASARPTRESTRQARDTASPSDPTDAAPTRTNHVSPPSTPDPSPGRNVSTPLHPTREVHPRSVTEQARKELRASAPPANSPPTPSIHVTIGRVEVRVTPPMNPAKSTPKKEPALSLDAYLRRRSQGGGR